MENLDIGQIAIIVIVVQIFDLVILLLTKTETILKILDRIKGLVGLDYRKRAKRADDEIRISKRHELVARDRVRHSFVTMALWRCKWTWNWSENLEPINIKGFCTGDAGFECSHPVYADYLEGIANSPNTRTIGITCSNPVTRLQNKGAADSIHNRTRHVVEVLKSVTKEDNSYDAFNTMISKAILSERDLRIAKEIRKLRLQFWR